MKLLKVGERFIYDGGEHEILDVIVGTDGHVFYVSDIYKDGDRWNIYIGVLDGDTIIPLHAVWDE